MGMSTVGQSMVWASPLILYSHAATVAPNNAGALYLLAGELVARRQVEDAAATYQRLILIAPRWGDAWLQLGTISFAARHYGEAESQLLQATELDKSNAAAFYLLGLTYDESHRLHEAETALRRAIELDPSGGGFHLALGSVLEEAGNTNAADAEFQEELQYHPENELVRKKLGK
jgi:Flp pilus assembly protein TadD